MREIAGYALLLSVLLIMAAMGFRYLLIEQTECRDRGGVYLKSAIFYECFMGQK